MKTNIAIIGLGSIGRRHLQAASGLSGIGPVICYDKRKNFQNEVNSFCLENSIDASQVKFMPDFISFLGSINKKTIVVISTTAKGRTGIVKNVIDKLPLAIISEKPLCQDLREYETMMALAKRTKVPIYLDFSRHLYPVYKEIYDAVQKAKDKTFSAFFSGGIACGGIHVLELATWLLDAKDYKILYFRKDEVFKNKRPGFRDFSGEIAFSVNGQNLCFLKATKNGNISSIRISCGHNEFTIFENAKKMVRLDWRSARTRVSDIEIPLLSQKIGKAIDAIRHGNVPELPTIFQSYLAHKILFEYMRKIRLEKLNIT